MGSIDLFVIEVLILFISYDIWEALSINSDLSSMNLRVDPLEQMVTSIQSFFSLEQLFL